MPSRLERVLKDRRENVTSQYARNAYWEDQENEEFEAFKRKFIATVSVIAALAIFIYVPQLFMKEKKVDYSDINYDIEAMGTCNSIIKDSPDMDFDNDHMLNSIEQDRKLSVWNPDTDGDGVMDFSELELKTNPSVKDNDLTKINEELLSKSGQSYDLAYKINGVTLWANSLKSRTYGTVVRTVDGGYQFADFDGYAQFPEGEYVYVYKNGIRTPLTDMKNGAYRIKGNCLVYSLSEKLEMTNKINLFGMEVYAGDNFITKSLSFILPDKGFVTSSRMAKDDIDAGAQKSQTILDFSEFKYSLKKERFTKNNNTLDDMVLVRQLINEKKPVAVSLYNDVNGEYIGIVYGYDEQGNLLICDKKTHNHVGVLKITMEASALYDGTDIKQHESFAFSGLTFDSDNGDRISFLNELF